jgi:hypothetical protein
MLPPGYRSKPASHAEDVEAQALGYFQQNGYTHAQAAGIVGNLKQESSLNPNEQNGYLAQWLGSRLAGLEAFAKRKGHASAAGNTEVQLEYILAELNGPERGAREALKRAKTPADAARVFSQLYERPLEPNLPARERYANEAAKKTPSISSSSPLQEGFEGIEEGVSGAVEGVESAVNAGADLLAIVTDPNTYLRLAEAIGGMVLLGMGLKTLTRGSGTAGPLAEVGRQARGAGHIAKKGAEVAAAGAVL